MCDEVNYFWPVVGSLMQTVKNRKVSPCQRLPKLIPLNWIQVADSIIGLFRYEKSEDLVLRRWGQNLSGPLGIGRLLVTGLAAYASLKASIP